MPRKALKVLVELKFRAVSCPGVHLPAKDDIYISMCVMGQYRQTECLPAVFPLLFNEKMIFEKIFRYAVDPADIAIMLEYETVRIELVQMVPPEGDTLAYFEEDARRFLFPEPKLVPSFSGVDQEILMNRAAYFPGIAPRMEFSTQTTIFECSADAEVNFYPNILLRPVMKRKTKSSSRPRTCSPQRKQPQTLVRRQGRRTDRDKDRDRRSSIRSQSLSPLRSGNTRRLARLSLDSGVPNPMLSSWPGAGRSDSPFRSAAFNRSSSPLARSSSTVRFSPTGRRKSLSNGLAGAKSEDDESSSETYDPGDNWDPESPSLWRSKETRLSRSLTSSHREWEEVNERVRGLLMTPKAVRRLVYGATVSEVDSTLARRSITPGPP